MTKRFFWSFIPFEVASVLMCLTMFTLLVSVVSGDEAAYEYDKLGRLIKVIYEDGPQFYYYYDKAGNRIEKQVTAPKSCGDVVVTNYTFTQDWTCGGSGQGLVIGGGGTTIDGSGHTLDGGGTGQGLVIGGSGIKGSETDTTEENPLIGDVSTQQEEPQPATMPEDKDTYEETVPMQVAAASPVSSPDMFTFHPKGNGSIGGKTIIRIPAMGVDLEKVYISNLRAKHLRAVRRVSSRLRVKNVYPGSLAEKAGIRPQDVILGFNNMGLTNIDQITRFLQAYKEGKKVELEIIRGDKIKQMVLKTVTVCGKRNRRQHETP